MKVFAISDLHLSIHNPKPMDIFGEVWDNYLDTIGAELAANVSDEDMVLIAGDISWAMTLDKAQPDLEYIARFPGKKILLRGNHDYWWKAISAIRRVLPAGVYALQNDCVRLGEYVVCGSRGWTTPEGRNQTDEDKTIYDREIIRTRMSLDAAAKVRGEGDKLIAMLHFPPFNSRFDRSPFTEMYREYKVDAVVYGHLHGRDSRVCRTLELDGIPYYLTSCDLIGNKPVQIF